MRSQTTWNNIIGHNYGVDYCWDDNTLIEYFCLPDQYCNATITCQNEGGCIEGRCAEDIEGAENFYTLSCAYGNETFPFHTDCEDTDGQNIFIDGETSVNFGGINPIFVFNDTIHAQFIFSFTIKSDSILVTSFFRIALE